MPLGGHQKSQTTTIARPREMTTLMWVQPLDPPLPNLLHHHPILCHSPAETKLSWEGSDSGVDPDFVGPESYMIWRVFLRKTIQNYKERVVRNLVFKRHNRNEDKFQILKSWQNTKCNTLIQKNKIILKVSAWRTSQIHSPTFRAACFWVASLYDNDFVKSFCLESIERYSRLSSSISWSELLFCFYWLFRKTSSGFPVDYW